MAPKVWGKFDRVLAAKTPSQKSYCTIETDPRANQKNYYEVTKIYGNLGQSYVITKQTLNKNEPVTAKKKKNQ